jgi:hypothetical protein
VGRADFLARVVRRAHGPLSTRSRAICAALCSFAKMGLLRSTLWVLRLGSDLFPPRPVAREWLKEWAFTQHEDTKAQSLKRFLVALWLRDFVVSPQD